MTIRFVKTKQNALITPSLIFDFTICSFPFTVAVMLHIVIITESQDTLGLFPRKHHKD